MKKAFFICGLFVLMFCTASCSKKNAQDIPVEYSRILQANNGGTGLTHRWFYFTEDGFKETDVPRNAPKVQKKPWTEAVRITSSVPIDGTGYFLVNKLGLLVCPAASGLQKEGIASKTFLVKDADIFSPAACGSLFCIDGTPVFNLYTNSIFASARFSAETNAAEKKLLPQTEKSDYFLVQYVKENRGFIPLLNSRDFNWPVKAELRELFFIDNIWYALLKETEAQRTEFYAYSFYTVEPVTAFAQARISSDTGASGFKPKLIHEEISVHEFREKIRPLRTSVMPERLKDLLAPVPPSVPWYLEYSADGSPSPFRFVQREHAPNPRQAYATTADHYSAAFFEDGTVCFAGTLPMKHVLNEGKPSVFKLPRLPAGYTYSYALIAGSTLFAAWEETAFFETGRSGFVAVDLEQVLYKKEE
ncbi:hypothetical protein H0R92_09125 [Treponema sp. OMZ 840]|uniref:hypothetical protein n=1 Tax=Treponema sp. OMZ 840 TaxID=244313 RepID=UPI003D8F7BAC